MPKVENVSQLVKDIMSERNLESDYKTFLHYPADSVIASDIGIFQKWICQISRMESPSLFKRCEYIKRHKFVYNIQNIVYFTKKKLQL